MSEADSLTDRSVDEYVGKRLKQKRILRGLSQSELGEALDITFQQIQKYELGFNRISASKLYGASRVLDESVAYFFEGLPGQIVRSQTDVPIDQEITEHYLRRETLALVKSFYNIKDPNVRALVRDLLRTITASSAV